MSKFTAKKANAKGKKEGRQKRDLGRSKVGRKAGDLFFTTYVQRHTQKQGGKIKWHWQVYWYEPSLWASGQCRRCDERYISLAGFRPIDETRRLKSQDASDMGCLFMTLLANGQVLARGQPRN